MSHPTAGAAIDPRKRITPESFSVAPHLLGLPLASPSRRLAAILVDLCGVALLANLGGKVLFAAGIGASFFWFAGRRLGKGGTFFSRSARVGFRGVGALFLFIAAASLWGSAQKRVRTAVDGDGGDGPQQASVAGGAANRAPSPLTAFRMVAEMHAVQTAPDSAHAAVAARAAVRQMRRVGMTDAQIREAVNDAAGDQDDEEKPWVAGAWRAALPTDSAAAAAPAQLPRDSLAALYLAAVRDGDTASAAALRPKLASVLARDSLDELEGRVSGLESEKRELERKVKEDEERGLLHTLLGLFDDLGIGFGWTGLYFTAFTALWRGQTPGKKLFGIRVLRLDGLPMTLWASFERFGGYAAGLFTGLTGYMQVYWDRNRQAIQDKISETVVIRDVVPVPPAPQPAWTPSVSTPPGGAWPPPRAPYPPYPPPAGPQQPGPPA